MATSQDTRYVGGAQRLAQRIATIRTSLALPPLVDAIGDLLLRRTLDRFDREVDPDGRKWAALSPFTLERKRRGGYGGENILVRTKHLRNSITKIRGRGVGAVYALTGAGVRIGVADPKIAEYARVHQYGEPGRVPARRFLGIGRLDVKSVDSFLRRRGQQAVSGA